MVNDLRCIELGLPPPPILGYGVIWIYLLYMSLLAPTSRPVWAWGFVRTGSAATVRKAPPVAGVSVAVALMLAYRAECAPSCGGWRRKFYRHIDLLHQAEYSAIILHAFADWLEGLAL